MSARRWYWLTSLPTNPTCTCALVWSALYPQLVNLQHRQLADSRLPKSWRIEFSRTNFAARSSDFAGR